MTSYFGSHIQKIILISDEFRVFGIMSSELYRKLTKEVIKVLYEAIVYLRKHRLTKEIAEELIYLEDKKIGTEPQNQSEILKKNQEEEAGSEKCPETNIIQGTALTGSESLKNGSPTDNDWIIGMNDLKIGPFLDRNRFWNIYAGANLGPVMINVKNNRGKMESVREFKENWLWSELFFNRYVPGVSLYTKLYEECFQFPQSSVLAILKQVLEGLGYLHSKNIVHANLNTQSIFYSQGKITLRDFGLVSVENQQIYIPLKFFSYPGLVIPKYWVNYQAPEILSIVSLSRHGQEAKKYNSKTDIYALG
ncbi:hypothetical protein RF11_02536 [Thelohanellus kitauei]|uniref:Protein kinase domain-containing protein n=1 Tax=Thelohanellus kitauei TaxID=669202 RepID=A0A0C2IZ22_THEKT|nr:hypothetical protein RF11_02536 [Thelohanellus kitauei]